MIPTDVAQQLDLPRPVAPPPGDAQPGRDGAAARGGRPGRTADGRSAFATARCSSCCMRRGCGSARPSGWTRDDLVDGGYVRVIGKGDKERLVPVGEIALAWLRRYDREVRPTWLADAPAGGWARGGPIFLTPRAGGWPASRRGRVVGGPARRRTRRSSHTAHAAPLLRDPPARGWRRSAHRPGTAGPCEHQHDADLHSRQRERIREIYARAHPRA